MMFLSIYLLAISSLPIGTLAIIFDEFSSLHIWITISALANRDPNNHRAFIFRQVELNWINAPLEDENDYLALYLDIEPDENILPVSVHRLNGLASGHIITDYYLPQIDFYNETINSINPSKQPFARKLDDVSSTTIYNFDNNNNYQQEQDILLNGQPQQQHHYNYLNNRGLIDSINEQNKWRKDNKIISSAGLKDECIGYCVAYFSKNKIIAKNCLKTNPNWMEETFKFIGSRSMPTLMIPGTHNSGTYPRKLDKNVLDLFNKYELNQDESIFNQLVYGVRHLDLRVGYKQVKSRSERLWIYHDIFRTEITVKEVLEQVARFLELTTHEVIIMDFHRFTVGFEDENLSTQREHHAKLIELILKHLEHYIIPSYLGLHAPISEYVALGKRLIIGYANKANIVGVDLNLLNQQNGMLQDKSIRDIDAVKQDQDEQQLFSLGNKNNKKPALQKEKNSIGPSLLKKMKLLTNSFISYSAIRQQRQQINQKMMILPSSDQDGQQFVDYDDETTTTTIIPKAQLFFQSVRHLWPNKDTIEGFAHYMNETTCRRYFGELSSMMIQLTPTVFGAISDKYDGNRNLAQMVNRMASDWIKNRWLHCINIVSSDYFLGNDLIRLSIYSNKMRVYRNNSIDLNSYGQCKAGFRKVEHLLDKSKIPHQFATHNQQPDQALLIDPDKQQKFELNNSYEYFQPHYQTQYNNNNNNINMKRTPPITVPETQADNMIIKHKTSDGNEIYLKPLTPSFNGGRFIGAGGNGVTSRQRKDSIVDNMSDGLSNIFSTFKKLLSF